MVAKALSKVEKEEIKVLLSMGVSDGNIKTRFEISNNQLGALKSAVKRQGKIIQDKVPAKTATDPIPTIPLEISVSELLAAGPEARIMIRLVK